MRNPALRSLFLGILVTLGTGPAARADLIFLKDGFVLQGTVQREGKIEFEGGEAIRIYKGFFMVDDLSRQTLFSPLQVERVIASPPSLLADNDFKMPRRIFYAPKTKALPAFNDGFEPAEWNDKWERTARIHTILGNVTLPQHLSILTPRHARIDSTSKWIWSGYYLTSELGPDTVRTLLSLHPDQKATKDKEETATRRFRLFYFLLQAGWHDQAEEELNSIRATMPEQKEKIASAQENLKKLRLQKQLDDIKRGHTAGRHEWVRKRLAEFPREDTDEKLLDQVRLLAEKYDTAVQNQRLARRFLSELPARITDPSQRRLFVEAAAVISAELTYDHFLKKDNDTDAGRLDAFLTLAQQAEQQKEGSQSQATPAQLMAVAVSGWLMGNSAADTKTEAARRLWNARLLVLKYQLTHDAKTRQELLKEYEARKSDAIGADEMAQLIGLLPPPEPEKAPPARMELVTNVQSSHSDKPTTYHLQVPPEYHPGRTYPVLFVLHEGGQKATDMLDRWSDLAAQHGYLLVAPEWGTALDDSYHYSVREHAAVLDVLRDLRRRFQVDSDRVFLSGCKEGGDMAYDVAMSHPDLFAGVLPISAQPGPFMVRYWRNVQYVPIYAVIGSWAGGRYGIPSRKAFENWVPRGYAVMAVMYSGRGLEWFPAELPAMFDWMSRKKRVHPFQDLGRDPQAGTLSQAFQTMRKTDNRFYWLTTDSIHDRHLNEGTTWDNQVIPATLQARISEGNHLNVNVTGLKQLTVWFPRGLVDFGKPVTIYLNLGVRWNKKVTPSLGTLLEDFYERGDRQRLFLARLEFDRF